MAPIIKVSCSIQLSYATKISNNIYVLRVGLEPTRSLLTNRFSYHFGFHRHCVRGLDFPFTLVFTLGVPCQVSAPSGNDYVSSLAQD